MYSSIILLIVQKLIHVIFSNVKITMTQYLLNHYKCTCFCQIISGKNLNLIKRLLNAEWKYTRCVGYKRKKGETFQNITYPT